MYPKINNCHQISHFPHVKVVRAHKLHYLITCKISLILNVLNCHLLYKMHIHGTNGQAIAMLICSHYNSKCKSLSITLFPIDYDHISYIKFSQKTLIINVHNSNITFENLNPTYLVAPHPIE